MADFPEDPNPKPTLARPALTYVDPRKDLCARPRESSHQICAEGTACFSWRGNPRSPRSDFVGARR
ncbi:hypothetical protein GCM10010404_11750 [Nonomuraea africana]